MKVNIWRRFDPWLFTPAILLTIIGIAFIHSATIGIEQFEELVPRQTIYAALGLGIALVVARFDYRNLLAIHWWIYGVILVLLATIFIAGQLGEAGARRWLLEGAVQPSELVKVLLIVTLAQYLALRKNQIGELRTVLYSLLYMAVPVAFLFLQPDLGMSIELLVIWFAMLWLAGLRWQHMVAFGASALAFVPVIWPYLETYQKQRIFAFIDPSLVPDQEFNMRQALISIASGGILGKGYASGPQTQLHFLRVRHTDFIFSVIAEELGLMGALVVLGLIAFLVFRILRVARISQDPGGVFLCYGVATLIFFQTVVSIGMNLQLLPVTGLTLPFISYGGSSLVTLLLSVGLVQSVLMHSIRTEEDS